MADEFNMDAAIASYRADAAPTMQNTMATAVTQNPDTQAQLARISADTGIPLGSAADNLAEAKRQQAIKAIDFPSYQANNPVAASMLANPVFAGIAHDDTENLGATENIFRAKDTSFGSAFSQGIAQPIQAIGQTFSVLGAQDTGGYFESFPSPENYQSASDAFINPPRNDNSVPSFSPLLNVPRALGFGVEYLPRATVEQFGQVFGSVITRLGGAAIGGAIGGAVGAPFAGVGALPGAAVGATTGAFAGPFLFEAAQIVGPVATARAKLNGYEKPTDEDMLYAWTTAASSGALNATGAKYLPGGEAAVGAVTKRVRRAILGESLTEGAQSLVQQVGTTADTKPGLQVSGKQALGEGILGGAAGGTITVGEIATVRAAERIKKTAERAATAEQNAATLEQLNTTAPESKFRERDPVAFANFVQQAAEAGGAETVYLDPRALFQSGIDPTELSKVSPSVASQLDQAVKTGVDIKIPTSEFATHLAGTDMGTALIDHLRMDPDAMSRSEAQAYMQTQGAQLEADVQKNVDNIALDNKVKQSQNEVEKNILGQLTNANRFTGDVNKVYASLIGNFFATQGARFGLTPEGLFDQYKLKIQAEGTNGKKGFFHGMADRLKAKPSIVGKDGNIELTHYSSTPGLASSDPAMWGKTGAALTRSERNRQASGAPGRTYFGASDYIKETQLGGIRYSASVPAAQLYDTTKDPLALRQKADENVKAGLDWDPTTAFEKLVIANGYKGAIIPTEKNGTAVAMYTPLPLTHVDEQGVMAPLEGAPKEQQAPSPVARYAAHQYMESKGLVYQPPTKYTPLDTSRAARLAAAFEAMEHNPEDTEVKAAYAAMIDETLEQYQQIKGTGLAIEFIGEGQENPYAATPRMAIDDVNQNNHLWVYPTESGFGTDDRFNNSPLFAKVDEYIDGKQLQANDVFRIVHDYFGHIKDGTGFRAAGEENAWQSHAAMFSPLARRAMTTETRGQNSWLNYGPHGEHNRTADQATTRYADQKVGLLPEWASEEGFVGGPETGTPLDAPGYNQSAYHGSDRHFDRFSLEHIGSGEGAQAYGWGLYFADNEAIARFYKNSVSQQKFKLDGKNPVFRSKFAKEEKETILDILTTVFDEFRNADGSVDLEGARNQIFYDAAAEAKTQGQGWYQEAYKLIRGVKQITSPEGALYKVEIPDDDNLLLWDTRLADQPLKAKEAMTAFMKKQSKVLWDAKANAAIAEGRFDDPSLAKVAGADFYRGAVATHPSSKAEAQRNVSLMLKDAGVSGLKYWDRNSRSEDKNTKQFNYVVFDDAAVKIAERYQQNTEQGTTRGFFNPETSIMTLLKAADLSTFLHESGHYFLEVMADLAGRENAPQEVKDDMQAALSWMGVPDLAAWQSYGIEQKREAHEKFARGFEAYLFEGKAPSIEIQGMFQRLRSWLLRVYKSIKNLNVELSSDIRGVFDRMLATADQIQEAENFRQMEALYGTMAESGMTSEEYMAYQKQGIQASQDAVTALEARSLRDMKWLSGARGRELKRLQKEAAGRRSEVKAEATKEVMSEPVNMATTFLKRGTINGEMIEGGTKLSIPEIEAMYGDNPIVGAIKEKLGVGKYGMLGRENAIHPDQVAEMFGFTSGDELVRTLLANENPQEKINGLTDQRMLERYGDLTDEDAMNRAADKAVHNEARAKFIATELDALSKAQGKKKVSRGAALAFVKVAVGRLRIMDLKPVRFAAAEARAALASMKAFKKGDLETAAIEKRNQLLNNYSAKEAYAAQDEVEKTLRYLKKFSKDGSRKKIDVSYLDQIDAILERFDLKPGTTLKSIRKRESLRAWIDGQVEQGLEPDIAPDILDEANRKSYKEMTVEEMRGLSDAIRQIDHLGRLKNKLLTEKDNREFKAVVSTIVDNINANANGRTADNRTRAGVGQALRLFKGYIAPHRKVASIVKELDGFVDGGPMWNTFVRTMNEAGDKEAGMREKATKKLAKLVQPILSGEKMNGKGRFFESIGKSMNREERIGVALNTGNLGNFQRLLDGEGWTHAQIAPVLDTLTKEDWDFVQNVWDLFESYRPEIGAKEKRIYGKEPNWVEPTVVNTKFGQYRGGYYPVKYDPTRSQQAEQFNDAEAAKAMLKGAFTSSTTRRSFTKARADEVKGRPLLYSMDGLYRGLNEVIHDLSWHEWLIDANRLMRSSLDGAIRNQYGADFVKQIKDGIKDIAAGEMANDGPLAGAANQLRIGATVAGIGFNIVNSVINITGLTQSFNRVGTKYMAMGLSEWAQNPRGLARRVQDMSEFMRLRAQTMNREINEIQSLVRGKSKARDIANKMMFMPLTLTQVAVDTPTWWGAYQKAMTEQDDQAKAVAMADQAVIDAQGGGQMKDLAAVQRGGALHKLFTTFYGYFSSTYNLAAEATNKTNFKDPMDVIRLAGDYLVLSVVPAFLGTILKTALTGGEDDWDAEELAQKLANDQISYLFGMMVGLRETTAVAQKLLGVNTFNSGYGGPAGLRFLQELDKLSSQIAQGEVDDAAVKSAINVLGILYKLPSGQINRTIFGTKALLEGETDNPLAVVTGPPPQN